MYNFGASPGTCSEGQASLKLTEVLSCICLINAGIKGVPPWPGINWCIISVAQWLHLVLLLPQLLTVPLKPLPHHLHVGRQMFKSLTFMVLINIHELDAGVITCYLREAEKADRWPSSFTDIPERDFSSAIPNQKGWPNSKSLPSISFLCLFSSSWLSLTLYDYIL